MKSDIQHIDDIVLLVDTFYHKAFQEPILAPHFEGLDFEKHKPHMVAFWAFVLLDKHGYTTNVFEKHTHLKVGRVHFQKWVEIFHQTVDELFVGEKANDAKLRATTIGWTFGEKMEKLQTNIDE
ncbi:MAG: group III truncated hemoglobin [Flavobacteriales bacterium]|jgi:hemoglobin